MHLIRAIMSPFTGVEAALKTAAKLAVCSRSGMTDCWKLEHGAWIEVWHHRGKWLSVLECDMRQYLPCSVSPFSKQKAGCQVQGLNGLDLPLEKFCLHWGKWDVQIAQEIQKLSSICIILYVIDMQTRWFVPCMYPFFCPLRSSALVLSISSLFKEKLTNCLKLLNPKLSCDKYGQNLCLWNFQRSHGRTEDIKIR